MSRRIVLDTNCLLQAISRRSRFYPIWRDFVQGRYVLCVTTEILDEYEEILSRHTSPVGFIVKGMSYSVISSNTLDCGFMETMIVDQGGHGPDFVMKDNVGCPMVR